MSRSTSRIRVDVFNPGQVFACYGFIDIADLLCGNVRAGFVDDEFVIEADGDVEPVKAAIDFIAGATVTGVLPSGASNRDYRLISVKEAEGRKKAKVEAEQTLKLENKARKARGEAVIKKEKTEREETAFVLDTHGAPDVCYPSPGREPAKIVARICNGGTAVDVTHWAEVSQRTGCDNVKFWAGAAGLPGAVMLDSAIGLVRSSNTKAYADPFNFQRPQSSSFRFDWRAGYIPMDIGWSLNSHSNASTAGYPLVDILAAIGLSHARPYFVKKLEYRYGILMGQGHRALFLRAALGGTLEGFHRLQFQIQLGWPGKEGQARAIVGVTEIANQKESV